MRMTGQVCFWPATDVVGKCYAGLDSPVKDIRPCGKANKKAGTWHRELSRCDARLRCYAARRLCNCPLTQFFVQFMNVEAIFSLQGSVFA